MFKLETMQDEILQQLQSSRPHLEEEALLPEAKILAKQKFEEWKNEKVDVRDIPEFAHFIEHKEDVSDPDFLRCINCIQKNSALSEKFRDFADRLCERFFEEEFNQTHKKVLLGIYNGWKSTLKEQHIQEEFACIQEGILKASEQWNTLDKPQKVSELITLLCQADDKKAVEAISRLSYLLFKLNLDNQDLFKEAVFENIA